MAAKSIPDHIKQTIIAEWRTGEYSQQKLADRHGVSKGAVNKLTKGIKQDTSVIVTAGIEYLQGLAGHDDRNVTAIEEVVDLKTKRLEVLNDLAMRNVQEAMEVRCIDQKDFKDRAGTISIAKEVIAGKNPEVAVQINNNQNNDRIPASEVRERVKTLGISVFNE